MGIVGQIKICFYLLNGEVGAGKQKIGNATGYIFKTYPIDQTT